MRRPNFFIVGAPRCGTTAMYTYLKAHPEVFMPDELKEPHFFGSDLKKDIHWYFNRIKNEAKYLNLFSKAQNKKRVGEASVFYFYSKSAPVEIKRFSPDAKIIIMVRNPVDMLFSFHTLMKFQGADIDTFDSEWHKSVNPSLPFNEFSFRDMTKLTTYIKNYIDVFTRNNVHVIIYDDLKNNTAITYNSVLAFLGIDESFCPNLEIINATPVGIVKNNKLSRFLFSHFPPKFVNCIRKFIPRPVRRGLQQIALNANISHQPPSLDPELRKRILSEIAPEIDQLSEFLGRDLRAWKV